MTKNNIFVSTDESTQYFECGYSCDHAILLYVSEREKYFITDARYVLEARNSVNKHTEVVDSANLFDELGILLKALKIKQIMLDPKRLNLNAYFTLLEFETAIVFQTNFSQRKRIIKTNKEIALLSKSQALNKKAFESLAKYICNNFDGISKKTEIDLHYIARGFLSDFGKYDLSFNPILAFDENAAKPHALPTDSIIDKKKILLFDAGIKYKRYCSDMTRSAEIKGEFDFNKTQKFKNKKMQKIYDIVLKAQENAIKNIKSGMSGKEIDALARNVIEKSSYGKYFTHSTGHGVGIDIHELPMISPISNDIIEDGMVFSIEPGIYLDNEFGIRIEELVVMRNGRAEIL